MVHTFISEAVVGFVPHAESQFVVNTELLERIQIMEEKCCLYCFEKLEKSTKESPKNWERRKYCDKKCAGLHSGEIVRRKAKLNDRLSLQNQTV